MLRATTKRSSTDPGPNTSPMKKILPCVASLLIFASSNFSAGATTIKYVTFHYSGVVTDVSGPADEFHVAVGDPFLLTLRVSTTLPPNPSPWSPCQDADGNYYPEGCYLDWRAILPGGELVPNDIYADGYEINPSGVWMNGETDTAPWALYTFTANTQLGGFLEFDGFFGESNTSFTATATARSVPESGTTFRLLGVGIITLGAAGMASRKGVRREHNRRLDVRS